MVPIRAPRSAANALGVSIVVLALILSLVPLTAAAQTHGLAQAKPAAPSISLSQLADVLENDKTRAKLVAELRAAAKAQKAGNGKTKAGLLARPGKKTETGKRRPSFARRFARTTSAEAEAIGARFTKVWTMFVAAKSQGPGLSFNARAFLTAAISFVSVAAATVAVFLVLRVLAAPLFAVIGRFARRAAGGGSGGLLLRRGLAVVLGIVVDAVVVLLAANAGYLLGLYGFGENGAMGTRESLFVNAFALIELIKVAIRALFSARFDSLRLLNISSVVAGWWSIRLRWFVGVIGYGMLVAVPIANGQLSFFVGGILTFLIMGGTYVYALIVMFKNHRLLTQRLQERARGTSIGFFAVLYRVFARLWLPIAVAYFTVLFIISQIAPVEALPFMLSATLQTAVAAAVGFAISGLLSRAIGRRLTFSQGLRERLPMLEARVNAYVPNALKVVRVVILLLVAAVIANAWHVFNFGAWLGSDAGLNTVGIAVRVAIVLVAAALLWLLAASVIEHRLSPNTGHGAPTARQQTLLILFRNVLAILIATFTLMIALSQIGVNIGPLVAGAGVFGLAIGFGAQTLVHDIISGVFIQLENAMNTGDVVSVGGVTGTAERLTIRSVSIRDIDGTYHIVPFSAASIVSNYMRDFAYFRTEFGIAYREDIDNAVVHLREAFTDLKADPSMGPNILEDITVPGVTALADSSINIRVMIKTKPGAQWGVGRAFNRLVKIHFDRAGIEMPFPHQTLYFGEDREGHAPPANLRLIDAMPEDAQPPQRLRKRRRSDDPAPEATGDAPPSV